MKQTVAACFKYERYKLCFEICREELNTVSYSYEDGAVWFLLIKKTEGNISGIY